jgi:ketosteroid isomerase-like protein
VRDGINAGDVDALVDLYEPDAVLLGEDGSAAAGTAQIRTAYESLVAYGGTISLQTRYAVESGDLAMLSNQYTFSMPGFSVSWITAEVARRQPDGSWRYVIDNPYAAPVAPD